MSGRKRRLGIMLSRGLQRGKGSEEDALPSSMKLVRGKGGARGEGSNCREQVAHRERITK